MSSWLETMSLGALAAAVSGRIVRGRPDLVASGVSIDSRTLRAGELFFAIVGPHFDGHDFLAQAAQRRAAAVVLARDQEVPEPLAVVRVADTTTALAALARHLRISSEVPVVAITGSAGKTTTKEMTAALLALKGPVLKTEGNLNNRYGLPLTLTRLDEEHTAAVLELGMSAPGELRALSAIAQPDIAVITNVGSAHLEFFGSIEAIAAAKAEVLEGLRAGGVAVLGGDDPQLVRIARAHQGEIVWFGRDRRFAVSAENWRGTAFGMRFDLVADGRTIDVALPLAGLHNVANFLAAAAVALRLGLDLDAIVAEALRFEAAAHRGQVLRLGRDVTLIDDAYNSNPQALEAAFSVLGMAGGKRRVAVVGDMLELGARGPEIHRAVGKKLAGAADVLVAVGPLAREIVRGTLATGKTPATYTFADATAAAAAIPTLVQAGDAVLVKGSRGVRLEQVVDALVAELGKRGA